jgi:hypothetical protein
VRRWAPSRAATTTACRRSRCWSRSCATARAWGEVIELLELRLAVEDAVEQRLAILGEIARIEELERRDVERAFAAWARALTEEATEAAPRQALERLAAATGAGSAGRGVRRAHGGDVRLRRCSGRWRCGWRRCTSRSWRSRRAAEFLRKALALPATKSPCWRRWR